MGELHYLADRNYVRTPHWDPAEAAVRRLARQADDGSDELLTTSERIWGEVDPSPEMRLCRDLMILIAHLHHDLLLGKRLYYWHGDRFPRDLVWRPVYDWRLNAIREQVEALPHLRGYAAEALDAIHRSATRHAALGMVQ